MAHSKLGQELVKSGHLSAIDCETLAKTCGVSPGAFAKGVIALGLMNEEKLADYIARVAGSPRVSEALAAQVDSEALGACTSEIAKKLEFIPLRIDQSMLHVGCIDPTDRSTIRQIEFFTGFKVKAQTATIGQIRAYLNQNVKGFEVKKTSLEKFLEDHVQQHGVSTKPSPDVNKNKHPENQNLPQTITVAPAVDAASSLAKDEDEFILTDNPILPLDGDLPSNASTESNLQTSTESEALQASTESNGPAPALIEEVGDMDLMTALNDTPKVSESVDPGIWDEPVADIATPPQAEPAEPVTQNMEAQPDPLETVETTEQESAALSIATQSENETLTEEDNLLPIESLPLEEHLKVDSTPTAQEVVPAADELFGALDHLEEQTETLQEPQNSIGTESDFAGTESDESSHFDLPDFSSLNSILVRLEIASNFRQALGHTHQGLRQNFASGALGRQSTNGTELLLLWTETTSSLDTPETLPKNAPIEFGKLIAKMTPGIHEDLRLTPDFAANWTSWDAICAWVAIPKSKTTTDEERWFFLGTDLQDLAKNPAWTESMDSVLRKIAMVYGSLRPASEEEAGQVG